MTWVRVDRRYEITWVRVDLVRVDLGYELTVINARRWVICEAGMCEAQRTTGTAGVVVGCEPL